MDNLATIQALAKDAARNPSDYWLTQAASVSWEKEPRTGLDANGLWYVDGVLNVCHNAVDRHVTAGRGNQPAVVWESPLSGQSTTITYAELLDEVSRFAGVLVKHGVNRGDRVLVYLPMIPQAAVAMLACARIGAVHSVVFGGFAARELAARIDDARPAAIVTASCGLEPGRIIDYTPMLDGAEALSEHPPVTRIVWQRDEAPVALRPGHVDWRAAMAAATPQPTAPVPSGHPLYVLYTSGTTGRPKGVVRDSGGYAVALSWAMRNVFDVHAGDTMFTASDVGWVVGHSFIVYGPLLAGATTVIHEGKPVGTPDAAQFWRVAAHHGARTIFTAPTAIRAIRKADPDGALVAEHDLAGLHYLFLAGERLDTDTHEWATRVLGIPVIDNWWQTETGWPMVANPMGLGAVPVKPGSAGPALPGWQVDVVDDSGTSVTPGREGAVVIRLPLPPGALTTLWQDDERFRSSYLEAVPGTYSTGDGGWIDEDGYVFITGRTDDVINVAGHRLSVGGLEEALARHPAVAEAAVIGVHDDLKGQVPRGFVVLKAGADLDPETLHAQLKQLVRDDVGAIASLRDVTVVDALPKTRSGKILRKPMRAIADGTQEIAVATIEDPAVLERLRSVLRTH